MHKKTIQEYLLEKGIHRGEKRRHSSAASDSSVTGARERPRVWAMLRRAVSEAGSSADYSAVSRVGIDDTARRHGRSYVSTMVDLDAQRVDAVTEGTDRDYFRAMVSLMLGRLDFSAQLAVSSATH